MINKIVKNSLFKLFLILIFLLSCNNKIKIFDGQNLPDTQISKLSYNREKSGEYFIIKINGKVLNEKINLMPNYCLLLLPGEYEIEIIGKKQRLKSIPQGKDGATLYYKWDVFPKNTLTFKLLAEKGKSYTLKCKPIFKYFWSRICDFWIEEKITRKKLIERKSIEWE